MECGIKWPTVEELNKCLNSKGRQATDGQGRQEDQGWDVSICTGKGYLCNKGDTWKPESFKEEKAGQGASQRFQISTAAWLCLTSIGIIFTLSISKITVKVIKTHCCISVNYVSLCTKIIMSTIYVQ